MFKFVLSMELCLNLYRGTMFKFVLSMELCLNLY